MVRQVARACRSAIVSPRLHTHEQVSEVARRSRPRVDGVARGLQRMQHVCRRGCMLGRLNHEANTLDLTPGKCEQLI